MFFLCIGKNLFKNTLHKSLTAVFIKNVYTVHTYLPEVSGDIVS